MPPQNAKNADIHAQCDRNLKDLQIAFQKQEDKIAAMEKKYKTDINVMTIKVNEKLNTIKEFEFEMEDMEIQVGKYKKQILDLTK